VEVIMAEHGMAKRRARLTRARKLCDIADHLKMTDIALFFIAVGVICITGVVMIVLSYCFNMSIGFVNGWGSLVLRWEFGLFASFMLLFIPFYIFAEWAESNYRKVFRSNRNFLR
jgi:choline-glycine betaine transporter